MSFKRTLLSSSIWSGIGKYSQYFTQLLTLSILARIIEPKYFGTLAIVTSINGFVLILSEAGFSSTIVQQKEIDQRVLSSIFWAALSIGLVLVLIMISSSRFLEGFFAFDGLSEVIQLMSFSLIVSSLSAIPDGILKRKLKFKLISISDITSSLLSSVTAIVLAILGFGIWSLIIQLLVRGIIRMIMIYRFSKWTPSLIFNLKSIKNSLSFSSYVLGFNSVNYWARNADNLMIGKVLGQVDLGFYNQAYRLMMIPYQGILGVINPTIHPIFASLKAEISEKRGKYLRLLRIITIISSATASFMFCWSEEIILILFGENWKNSITTFSYLAIVSAIQPITATTGPVLLSCNRADLYFKLGVFSSSVYLIGFILTVNYGYESLAIGYVVSNLIVSPIVFYWTYKLQLKGGFLDILRLFFFIVGFFAAYNVAMVIVKLVLLDFGIEVKLLTGGFFTFLILIIFLRRSIRELWKLRSRKN